MSQSLPLTAALTMIVARPHNTKGMPDMAKKQEAPLIISDYTLMQVTLTVAVSTYLCDEHSKQAESEAIEIVLEQLHDLDGDIIVLGSKFQPLTLTKVI